MPFRTISWRLEILFLGLIVILGLNTVLINYNVLSAGTIQKIIEDKINLVIHNSDERFEASAQDRGNIGKLTIAILHAIQNQTKQISDKGDARANATINHFEDLIGQQLNQTKENNQLLKQLLDLESNKNKTL